MALLIEKQEALTLLRQNVKHYLWNKSMSRWTEQDVFNLRNGININIGNILREKAPRNSNPYSEKQMMVSERNYSYGNNRQPILVTNNDITLRYDSIVKASEATGVPATNIYALVNGRYAKSFGFTFIKL